MTPEYVAGFFDGEGSVWVRTYPDGHRAANLIFYNTHLETLQAIRAFLGVGVLRRRSGMAARVRVVRGHPKPQWQLAIQGNRQARRILEMLQPLVLVKRVAVDEALRATEPITARRCVVCGAGFESLRRNAIYCRKACNQAAYERRQVEKGLRRGHRGPWH